MRLALAFLALSSIGCGGLLSIHPTVNQQADVRQLAARVADGLTTGLVILDQGAAAVDQLSVSNAVKDGVDCTVLKLTGNDAPSATVLKVCGPIPPVALSPVSQALTALRSLSTKASLCSTVKTVTIAITPVYAKLEAAGLQNFSLMLKTALGMSGIVLGGCS